MDNAGIECLFAQSQYPNLAMYKVHRNVTGWPVPNIYLNWFLIIHQNKDRAIIFLAAAFKMTFYYYVVREATLINQF